MHLPLKYVCNYLIALVLILSIALTQAWAQVNPVQPPSNQTNTEDKIERAAEQGDENVDYDELQQQFETFLKQPLNLNAANYSELIESGLFDEIQVSNLLQHIEKNGPLIAFEELQSIDGFDVLSLQRIAPYVTTGSTADDLHLSPKQLLQAGTNQVLIRTGRNLNEQYGYTVTDTSMNRYLGSPWVLYARYRFSFSKKYSFGITAEKDAGEEFFTGTQKQGFDYYSAHLYVRDIGVIKKISVGDYQLEYGQGLNVWSGLAFGKSPDITTIKRNARGIMPYTSVNEESFKRGAAVAIGMKNFQLDVWYSSRKVDGNLLVQDSLQSEFIVSSLQSSGLHRTPSEVADKNTIGIQSAGSHLSYAQKKFEVGITVSNTHLDKPLERDNTPYNQFQFAGDNFFNVSLDYRFAVRNFNFFGEAVRSNNNAYAYMNGVIVSLDPRLSVSVLQRNYQRSFQAIESNALRESNNFNEKGYMIGANFKPVKTIALSGYFDMFSFPWLRYQVYAPSSGYEYLWQLTYTPNKKLEMYVRNKQTVKPQNTDVVSDIDFLVDVNQSASRFNISYKISPSVTIRSRIDFIKIKREDADDNAGIALIQDVFFKPVNSRFSAIVRFVLFDTDTYDSRVYAYENDVYGVFSIPSYYYSGMRYYINVRYSIMRNFDFYVRLAQTVYTNQTTVGSSLDEINNNSKSDLRFALKYEF